MFTPVETTFGALLLHQATTALLFNNGSVLGASGLLRGLLSSPSRTNIFFFGGMALSFVPLKLLLPQYIPDYPPMSMTWQSTLTAVGAGLLTGWGTKGCNGCTSGHMLCGLSRLSGRSFIAVMTFFPTAIITSLLAGTSKHTALCPPDVTCYLPSYPSQTTTATLAGLTVSSLLANHFGPKLCDRITDNKESARYCTAMLTGLTFGLGLLVSGLAIPAKVLSFFSLGPDGLKHWDPSLLLVIGFGIIPNLIVNKVKGFKEPPCYGDCYSLPTKTVKDIDWKFIAGAVAFGVAWGLSGSCPGPAALRSVAQPAWGALWIPSFWLGGKLMP